MLTLAAQCCTRPAVAVRSARSSRHRAPRSIVQRVRAQSGYESDNEGENVGAFCSIDPSSGGKPMKQLSLEEKEQMFLASLASFYYETGDSRISNEEYDLLKEELIWSGSKVATLSTDEKRLLEARQAYKTGSPIMSDAEYDALKASLAGSAVFSLPRSGPVCTLGKDPSKRGRTINEAKPDYLRMGALAAPAPLVIGGLLLATDAFTGGNLIHLDGKLGVIVWCAVILPTFYVMANAVSDLLFKDALVLQGDCPHCGEPNLRTYFGSILSVEGNRDQNVVACPCCESKLTFDRKKRAVTVTEVVA